MYSQKKKAVMAVLLGVLLLTSACSLTNPLKKPDPEPAPPKKQVTGTEPAIMVYMHETGEKKNMKMEEYIAGVVAGEMKSDWPVEALAAQAIIARTFTIAAIEEKGGVPARGTQASTDVKEFQAYNAHDVNDNVKKAVDMTRGMVITYQGKVATTWFHASAGGITATAKEGLNFKDAEPPYIQSVNSPDDMAPDDVKNWTAVFNAQEVVQGLEKMGKKVASVESMAVSEKGPSGRAVTLAVNGSEMVSGPELRMALGSTKLKSMLLDSVDVIGDTVVFKGKGFGHGVGMSQWGAYKLAKDGQKPEEIIGHYFRGVTIEKRWE